MYDSRQEKVSLVIIGLVFALLFDRYNNYYNRRLSALEKIMQDADCPSLRGEVNHLKFEVESDTIPDVFKKIATLEANLRTQMAPLSGFMQRTTTLEGTLSTETIPAIHLLNEHVNHMSSKILSLEEQLNKLQNKKP